MQVLSAIPDEEFSVSSQQSRRLISSFSQAVALPPRLKVKWLRTDCMSELDLRGVQLSNSDWNSLVPSLSAVPGLLALHVCLPRYQEVTPVNPRDEYQVDIKKTVRIEFTSAGCSTRRLMQSLSNQKSI